MKDDRKRIVRIVRSNPHGSVFHVREIGFAAKS